MEPSSDPFTFGDKQAIKIEIPGKTFVVGEYTATQGGPSLIFTSQPLFKLSILNKNDETQPGGPFHPHSPAGKLYKKYQSLLDAYQFTFFNPYHFGGLGASTAEFLSLYYFICAQTNTPLPDNAEMVNVYRAYCLPTGLTPSGADLVAQHHRKVSYYNPNNNHHSAHQWPFANLSLLLFHTNNKLQTHSHLSSISSKSVNFSRLEAAALNAIEGFLLSNERHFTDSINDFNSCLKELKLISKHTVDIIDALTKHPSCLATKGCGALGADVILVLCRSENETQLIQSMTALNCSFICNHQKLAFPRSASI